MKFPRRITVAVSAVVLCASALTVSSCSLGPQDVPSIGGRTSNGYHITLHFSNVMNLPPGAYIMMNGLQVGTVDNVDASGSGVSVTAKISGGTHIPADAQAAIRQDTLLGDTYIGLDNSVNAQSGGYLPPGGTIPVSRTTSPPSLEDVMAVMAYFVNGGSIQKAEDAMGRINTVMPSITEVRKLATVAAGDMHDLSQNTADMDHTLAGFDRTAVALNAKSATLNQVLLNPAALHYWHSIAKAMYVHVSTMLPAIGSIFEGGAWLDPLLDSLDHTVGSGRGTWDSAPATAQSMATFLRTTVLPFAQNPSVNIRSVSGPGGEQLVGDMENVLRMLGAMK